MSSDILLPFVSVIVPAYNGVGSVRPLAQSLLDQTYPHDRYEIIFVDNGSRDNTLAVLHEYPVMILQESIQSSYAARNRGIVHAQGEIIAFTDADCIPEKNWIEQGVQFLRVEHRNIAGGRVVYTFSEFPSAAEYVDSLINIHNESSIARHGMAATANLFSRKSCIEKVGLFNQKLKSGGDGEWSARARRSGEVIHYASQVVIYHPARNFRELMKKHVRVGSGSMAVWKARGKSISWRLGAFLYLLTPLFAFTIPRIIRNNGNSEINYPVARMILVAYFCKLATAWGILKNLLQVRGFKKSYGKLE